MQFLDNLFSSSPGSLGTREASGRGPGCDEGKWDWGDGEGGVVSDLTLKSVPCPSSPGVVPHSEGGGGREGGDTGSRAGLAPMCRTPRGTGQAPDLSNCSFSTLSG